jgi:hypothetical protein
MASNEPTDGEVIEQIQNTAGAGARFSPGSKVPDNLSSSRSKTTLIEFETHASAMRAQLVGTQTCIDCMRCIMKVCRLDIQCNLASVWPWRWAAFQ